MSDRPDGQRSRASQLLEVATVLLATAPELLPYMLSPRRGSHDRDHRTDHDTLRLLSVRNRPLDGA